MDAFQRTITAAAGITADLAITMTLRQLALEAFLHVDAEAFEAFAERFAAERRDRIADVIAARRNEERPGSSSDSTPA